MGNVVRERTDLIGGDSARTMSKTIRNEGSGSALRCLA